MYIILYQKRNIRKIDLLFFFISQNTHFLLILSVYYQRFIFASITTTSISIKPSNIFCRCVAHQNRIYESYSKLMHDRTISNRDAQIEQNEERAR